MEVIGSIYTGVTADFQRGVYPIVRCVKAEQHDLGVALIEVPHAIEGFFKQFVLENLAKAFPDVQFIASSKDFFLSLNDYINLVFPPNNAFETKMYCTKKEWNETIAFLYENENNKELLLCEL